MAHQISSFQFNHGGIQNQHPAVSNQSFESDPITLFETWIAREDDSSEHDHHQSLFQSYSNDTEEDYPLIHHHSTISEPQSISDFNVNRQVSVDSSDEPINGSNEIPNYSDSASALFDMLRVGSRKRNSSSRTVHKPSVIEPVDSVALSTEELIRIAGARFIHFSSESGDSVAGSFDLTFSGLSDEELKNVELAEFLLMAAEKVGDEQFERASSLLAECDLQSSTTGDPVQRLVYYFSRALWERIDRQTAKQTIEKSPKIPKVQAMMMPPRECFLEFYEKVPFAQVSEFAAIQAVVDSVATSRRIHIVDFNIKNGEQWTIFMQALVSRVETPVDHLKITAVGTVGKEMLEETGKRLIGFAEAMELSFSFKLIMVDDYMELKEEMFEIDCDETVAVLSEYLLTTIISSVVKLDYVMKMIWKIKPCVMVVTEVESNHNSPVFVNRFIEALFYVSAYFDCLETCMERDNPHRMFAESSFFGEGTKIVVANEGEERAIRNVTMDVWRAYFRRFGMEEADLSLSCVYQAELVANKFPCWKSCTVEVDAPQIWIFTRKD
ncbi:DELLA protein RGL2 [Linum grandiflorum]